MAEHARSSEPRSATESPKEQEQPVQEGEYIEHVRNVFDRFATKPVWLPTRHGAKKADLLFA